MCSNLLDRSVEAMKIEVLCLQRRGARIALTLIFFLTTGAGVLLCFGEMLPIYAKPHADATDIMMSAPFCEEGAGMKDVGNGVYATSFMIGEEDAGKVWQAPDALAEEPLSGYAVVDVCLDREGEVIDAWVILLIVRPANESERHTLYRTNSLRPESYPSEVEPYADWLQSVVEETSFVIGNEDILEDENVMGVIYKFEVQ